MKRVLLADDSVAGRKSIQSVLEVAGIELVTVGNGDLAISKLDEVSPEMVLLDVVMPGRSGYEVCAEIKKDERFKSIPVMLVTSEFEPYDEQAAAAAGADGHLIKPFGTQAIAQMRDAWARVAPVPTGDIEVRPDVAAPKPPPPMQFPGPEAFITSAMKASDVEKAVAEKQNVKQSLDTGGNLALPAGAEGGSPVPDHLIDDTISPDRAQRRAATTEHLDADVADAADSAASANIRQIPIGDLRSQGDWCPNCGVALTAGDIFCVSCGTMVLMTTEEAEQKPVVPTCGDCGAELLPGEIFCVACGAVAGGVDAGADHPADSERG